MHLRTYSHVILQKIRFCTILYLRTFQKPIFLFGRLFCMPKMAKPKTPEMSSPLREEESEYRNRTNLISEVGIVSSLSDFT